VFDGGVSVDSLRMVSYEGLEGGSKSSWLYWFQLEPESSAMLIVVLLGMCYN
jgi:hypothetical protein